MSQERERRFLVKYLPAGYRSFDHAKMRQGYLAVEDDREVRVREKIDSRGKASYYIGAKLGAGETREDPEIKITQEEFDRFWSVTEGRRLAKTRWDLPYGDLTLELDIFEEQLAGYIHVEVEFDDEAQSKAFVPPDWFGEEVTDDPRHNGRNLARFGAPREQASVPIYDLEDGVARLVQDVERHWVFRDQNTGTIVLIAGGSASGKTSAVAKRVSDHFGNNALILSMDDYYRGATYVKANGLNFDQPEALDLPLLAEHLMTLKRSEAVEKPIYSFKTGEREGYERVEPRPIIILEGLFALSSELASIGNVRVFVDIGMHGRIIRRLLRDVSRSSWGANEILGYFAKVVEPMHDKYIETTKRNADIVIRNEYNPAVEASRSGLHEIQVKFAGTIEEQKLRAAGAERIGTAYQFDVYYSPPEKDLAKTGEMLRVREEGGRLTLTYKGPRIASEFRKRPKFECEIDGETRDAILRLYSLHQRKIVKSRTLYLISGAIIAVDDAITVLTDDGSPDRQLGAFTELRTTDHAASEQALSALIATLGLDPTQKITASYLEM